MDSLSMQDLQNLPAADKAELQNFIRNETQKSIIQQSKNPSRCSSSLAIPVVPTLCPLLTLLNVLSVLIKVTVRPATTLRAKDKLD